MAQEIESAYLLTHGKVLHKDQHEAQQITTRSMLLQPAASARSRLKHHRVLPPTDVVPPGPREALTDERCDAMHEQMLRAAQTKCESVKCNCIW